MTLDEDEWVQLAELIGPLHLPRVYCPIEPTPKQEWFLRRDEKEVFFGGAAGPGKALSVQTAIATTAGWVTLADIREGDEVFDREGERRRVTAVGPVHFGRPCMEVVFSDGETIVADEQHEWITLTYKERGQAVRRTSESRARRQAGRASRVSGNKSTRFTESLSARNRERAYDLLDPPTPSVRETGEIARTLYHGGRVNHAVPVASPLNLSTRELPIDPYTLGVWLGDGTSSTGTIVNHPSDSEIIDLIPYPTRRYDSNQLIVRVEGLTAMLRDVGVRGDKHIPMDYLRAGFEQRLAVLQGIVDTDGHVDKRDGRVEVTLTRWRLIEGVAELLSTLGIRFSLAESRATLDGRDIGPRWRIAFQTGLQVARLSRKRDAQNRGPFRTWHDHRYIVDVRRVESVPVRCIEVEGGIYLAGQRMIPTHNSWALLMAALQYVDVPGYHALLLRPALTDFEGANGLFNVAHEWLARTDAQWHGGRREWLFPSGASVRFGYLANMADIGRYMGKAYSFIGWDEITLFTEELYTQMLRALRQPIEGPISSVPVRVRSTSNPGGPGHSWVKTRFVVPASRAEGAVYIPATIHDNPHLDYAVYLETLSHMHPVDRARLINGDWDVMEEGGKFHREDFIVVDDVPERPTQVVRYWDLAASEPSHSNPDPDFTVGLRLESSSSGLFTIRHIVRGRWPGHIVEERVRETARADGRSVIVYIEQEPGASGKSLISHYQRKVLAGFGCHKGLPRGDKEVRARPVAAAVANGLVRVIRGNHTLELLDEAAIFPNGQHDDIVDALSGAHTYLTKRSGGSGRTSVPRGRIGTAGMTPRDIPRL